MSGSSWAILYAGPDRPENEERAWDRTAQAWVLLPQASVYTQHERELGLVLPRHGRWTEHVNLQSDVAPWGERGKLRHNEDGSPVVEIAECGHCERQWNDALGTSLTPVPSGRCPFEYDHEYPDDSFDGQTDEEDEEPAPRFEVRFETGSAAFDGGGGDMEVQRILRSIADQIGFGHTSGKIHDGNGIGVGSWSLTLPTEAEQEP